MQKFKIMKLDEKFKKEIAKQLKQDLGIKNEMAIPKLEKIVLNMGVKDAIADKKNVDRAAELMVQIAGQKPAIKKAKKAVAAFKLREGDPIGVAVTLRGRRMYDFYEKLVSIVMPRIRDFRGVKTESFDKKGNYTLGFSEATVFAEIDPSKIERQQGLEITIVTTAKDEKEGLALLKALGMPFKK